MRGKQAKRLRHLAKIQAGRILMENRDEVPQEKLAATAVHIVRDVYKVLKRAWKAQSAPKSLVYVDVERPSRSRFVDRMMRSIAERRS
jgi:hypothetical protein